ncbi:aminotransferase class I/II-fold pyridoxal phosphate-dependent enzyme [Paenibacillus gansuensis]|uniref:Aminotransferase class I/II-fold pyridoxal phosphate-dependent enzyme n=1 Tax=Paenibacillus gansuensis TaxID=306542 RepID=A0ABW5P8E0_9BACL
MNPHNAPLYDKLMKHATGHPHSFHVPGHKMGQAFKATASHTFREIMRIDQTEISGLDDLHHPEGVIAEAQELAAECFGAEETFFLIGGSTAGNLAAVLSLCGRGDKLIVQRNVHKSVLNGLMLAGAEAVFLSPELEEQTSLATIPSLAAVEEALLKYPLAKGVLLTNPNYYGMGKCLKPYIELIHRYGKPVIIDEAHGAHYGFHSRLPETAVRHGADLVVQSTHKMLSAMTMGAMIHVNGSLVNRHSLKRTLAMIQSSSPSYPIMASLDAARRQVHTAGGALFEEGLASVDWFRNRMGEVKSYEVVNIRGTIAGEPDKDGLTFDPFKVVIKDTTGMMTGYELLEAVEEYGCFGEMADPEYAVFVFSLGSTMEDARALYHALQHVAERHETIPNPRRKQVYNIPAYPAMTDPIAMGWNANDYQIKTIQLEQAAGYLSAEMIIPYPPGIPILYPGETVTQQTVEYLMVLRDTGAKIQGARDASLHYIDIRYE